MIIARVLGNVVSTLKEGHHVGKKIMVVQPLDPQGREAGESFLSIDTVQAGQGDLVLVMREGGASRIAVRDETAPVHSVIIGVIDSVNLAGGAR